MNARTCQLIKSQMDSLRISQVELADRLAMTPSQISRIISGERGTTLENLLMIADVLKIDRTYFLRTAAGLHPDPESDEWEEQTNRLLKILPHRKRSIATSLIKALLEEDGEESEPPRTLAPSRRGAKS